MYLSPYQDDDDDDDEYGDSEDERGESPPPAEPVERKPNSRGCKVQFQAGQALTHQFDDSNLWAHGTCVCVSVCMRQYVPGMLQCHISYMAMQC